MKTNTKYILTGLFLLTVLVLVFLRFQTETVKTKGIMILIESTDEPTGLASMVDEMEKRNIPGLLMVTPEFVQANCAEVKDAVSSGDIEIVASNVSAPFWGMPYEEQKSRISKMLTGISSCTGTTPRIISSRYMASDMNTIKAAEELGVPYITARGTTGNKATVYQPDGYQVKILSVSNIQLVPFEYGSLCDYSFYERAGTPEDLKGELSRAMEPLTLKEKEWFGKYSRITPVSHTYIGGHLKAWHEMWISFWDTADIEWQNMDDFMAQPDWKMPLWQIPTNINNPYTEEKVRPLTSYEQEEKVTNPCAVINTENIAPDSPESSNEKISPDKIVVFHNGQGPMCVEFLNFVQSLDYPVEQHLTEDKDFKEIFQDYKNASPKSEGLSSSFDYYPVIFIKGRAFSGFNEEIKDEILKETKN